MGFPAPDLEITNNTPYGVLIWTVVHRHQPHRARCTPRRTPRPSRPAIAEGPSGNCTVVTTTRTRTYPDGTTETDKFRATYRPGEGSDC